MLGPATGERQQVLMMAEEEEEEEDELLTMEEVVVRQQYELDSSVHLKTIPEEDNSI